MVFPVVMYECENRTIKKAEHLRTDTFEPCCWRKLKVPLTARRSKQSIFRKINPEYSLEGLMMELKFQYFDHLIRTDNLLDKSLMWERSKAEGEEGIRE